MGILSKDKRKIRLYYHSDTSLGKQIYAYVEASSKSILAIDIAKTEVPGSHWVEIAEGLGVELADLINKNHPDFTKEYSSEDVDLNTEDWIKVLRNNPHLLGGSIVINGNQIIALKSPSDFMPFLEADNTGVEKME